MSARCAVHSEQGAGGTCERCGAFGCAKCLPPRTALCLACTHRFDGEPLESAIRWVSERVSAVRLGVGLASTLVGLGFSLLFLYFVRAGVIGGLISAAIIALCIAVARLVTKVLLTFLAPYWISRAQAQFELHDEVLRELRVVLR